NGDSFIARQEVDQRVITVANTFLTDVDRMLQRARLSAEQATQLLKQFNPSGPAADVAEMYFVQADVENTIGGHYCNGLSFSGGGNGLEQYGPPIPGAAAFARALAHADSGRALIPGATASDVKVKTALSIVKARILTNLNRQSEAA